MLRNKINFIYLSWFIAVLNIFDGVTTAYGLKEGKIEELNPIMDFLWVTSPLLFLALKFSLSVLIVIISIFVYKKSRKTFSWRIFCFISRGMLCVFRYIFSPYHVAFFSIINKKLTNLYRLANFYDVKLHRYFISFG